MNRCRAKLKKIRFPAVVCLLFLLIAAIIVYIFLGLTREAAVTAMGKGAPSAHTLVIDPGHGGLDGGASAKDGTTESAVNLAIALRMEQLAKLFGVPAVMTRRTEELDYPDTAKTVRAKKVWDQKTRVETINATGGAVLISVHQNTYPDVRPRGTEVLYAKTEGSAALAELAHANLIACLNPENRRVAAPISDKIYLMKQVRCPAILVECGFLSNPAEAEKLKTGSYQTALAAVLFASYMQYTGMGEI